MKTRKCIISLILVLALALSAIPANAAQLSSDVPDDVSVAAAASDFDFSDQDDLNKYDQYEKRRWDKWDNAIDYVEIAAVKGIGGVNPEPIDMARYGAFLRNSSETQYYSIYNLKYTTKNISSNVLTIYADPEVNFVVMNQSGTRIVNNGGILDSREVKRFNSSLDNGHRVYYVELVPQEMADGTYMIEFRTDSTTTQPHYSVWFGCPLMLTKTASIGRARLSVSYPNTSASCTLSSGRNLPAESWISSVHITNITRSGEKNLSQADLYVKYPGGKTSMSYSAKLDSSYTINYYPSVTTAIPARGTYSLHLNKIRWGL